MLCSAVHQNLGASKKHAEWRYRVLRLAGGDIALMAFSAMGLKAQIIIIFI